MEQTQQSLDLQCKQERSRAQMELEAAEKRHQGAMLDLEHEQAVRHAAERERAALEALRAKNEEELRFNESLSKLGVELTQYLCVKEQRQPDHHIKVESAGNGAGASSAAAPAVHLEV